MNRNEWLETRRTGIGGSDVAAILGLSPWKTPLDVYLDKIGEGEQFELEDNEPAYWGVQLEEVVAAEYAKRTGNKIQRCNILLRAPGAEWMIANLDRVVWQDGKMPVVKGEIRTKHLLECKTASAYKAKEWGSVDDLAAVPVYYTTQAMWYLAVTGADVIDVAVLIGGQKYLQKRVERDDDLIATIIERCRSFWFDHVVARIPPPATYGEEAAKLYPQDDGSAIEASGDVLEAFVKARDLRAQLKRIELELDGDKKSGVIGLLDVIKTKLGPATTLTIDGKPALTWKAAKGSSRTDWKSAADQIKGWVIEKEIPEAVDAIRDIIDQNTTQTEGSRRLLFKD